MIENALQKDWESPTPLFFRWAPDVATYNALIKAYRETAEFERALGVLQRMEAAGLVPDRCVLQNFQPFAEMLITVTAMIPSRYREVRAKISSVLLLAMIFCIACQLILMQDAMPSRMLLCLFFLAHSLFRTGLLHVSWCSLTAICMLPLCPSRTLMVFFQRKVEQDAAHDSFCLIIFIMLFSFKKKRNQSSPGKRRRLHQERTFFGAMLCWMLLLTPRPSTTTSNVCVPRISFNTLLDASLDAKPSDPDAVLDLMDKQGVKPDTTTFNTLIKRCVCIRTCQEAIWYLN